jgi:GTP 3',8-cyclase
MDPARFARLTRGGDINKVFEGIAAAREAGLTPVKLNCVVMKSSGEENAGEVARYASANGFEIRFIHQMDLRTGEFSIVEGGDGGDCGKCNRLRLTANGKIKPCLFSDLEFDVRQLGAAKAMEMAVNQKPACGSLNNNGHFYNIGG